MRRLSGLDAQFFYNETPSVHMHTLKISFLKPKDGYDFARSKDGLKRRLHLLPPFHWRRVNTPFGLHHPIWIEDPNFDLDYHVRRMAVPAPHTDRELCELISDISGWPMDQTKPLWQIWMVEGLASGEVVSVAKVHHAIADGVSSAELVMNYFSEEPHSIDVVELKPLPAAESVPTWGRRLGSALVDVGKDLFHELPRLLRARRERRRLSEDVPEMPGLGQCPVTPLNGPITPHRTFAYQTLPLAEVMNLRKVFGATVNDIVMAMVAGALRRYLDDKGNVPDERLVAGMPASTRTEEQRKTWGNRLVNICVPLATDVADPVERLAATHEMTQAAKQELEATRGTRLEDWAAIWPPFLLKALGRVFALQVKRGGPSIFNATVSNVPGPRKRLYSYEDEVSNFISVGPVLDGAALNITVWSYVDNLNFCLLACRERVPDIWQLVEYLNMSFDELTKAAKQREAQLA